MVFKHIEGKEAMSFLKYYYFVEPKFVWYFLGVFSLAITIADVAINDGDVFYSIVGMGLLILIILLYLFTDFLMRLIKVNKDRSIYVAKGEKVPKWLDLKSCNPWSE
jgi:hypothetical protein